MDYFHSQNAVPAANFAATGWDISGSVRPPVGAARPTLGVLVSALGEKKQVLIAPQADFTAFVEGRLASSTVPAQGRTIVGVVAQPPIQGTPDPKPKRRSKKDAPWFPLAKGMEVTLSIPKLVREFALQAADRAGILGFQLTVFITLAPDIDGLSPPERVKFWRKCLNRLRAYCRQREKKLGRPFPAVYLATRESDPVTHLGEHLHLLAHAPDRAEADHMTEVVRKWFKNKSKKATAGREGAEGTGGSVDDDVVEDPNAAHAKRVDTRERFRGGKLRSVIRYVFKAANSQSWKFDSTILWKMSGAIAGPRVFISRNLTNRDAVAATRDAVEAVELARQGVIQAGRDGFVPAPAPSVAPLAIAPPPAEVVPVEVPAEVVPAAPAHAPIEPITVEPEPASIVESICPGHSRAGSMSPEADVSFDVEIQRAEPMPIHREPAEAMVEVPVEAVVHDEDTAPPLPASVAIPPAVGLATATPAENVSDTPEPASSSPKAVLAPLAAFCRSVVRGVAAGVGWVAARAAAGPPASPPSAARRPRAPLFDRSAFIAAGAFLGAPDVRSDPW